MRLPASSKLDLCARRVFEEKIDLRAAFWSICCRRALILPAIKAGVNVFSVIEKPVWRKTTDNVCMAGKTVKETNWVSIASDFCR